MPRTKKISVCLVAILLLTVIILAVWNYSAPASNREKTDIAVAYLNSNSELKAFSDHRPFRDYFHEYKGIALHVIEGGTSENGGASKGTILFLHGFPSFWYSLVRQIEALRSEYKIIAIDGLGAGLSDAPMEDFHYQQEKMSLHILALMDSLEADKFHLVGHDWGSALALGMAQRYPDRVLSVTGISAPPTNVLLELVENNPQQREKYQYVERLKGASPVLLALLSIPSKIFQDAYSPLVTNRYLRPEEGALFKQATSNPKRINTHINWYRANLPNREDIRDEDYWPTRVANFSMPTTLVWGNNDQTFSKVFLEVVAEAGNEVEIVEIPGAGHWPHIERPVLVNQAIRRTIEKAIR